MLIESGSIDRPHRIVGKDGMPVASIFTPQKTDVRLIASAPDLLETLRELIVQIYEDVPDDIVSDHFRDALVAAEAAIHKATGDAQ
jgi:hypothetical protein